MSFRPVYFYAGIIGLILLFFMILNDLLNRQSIGIFLLITSPGDLIIAGNDNRTEKILDLFYKQRGIIYYLFLYGVIYLASCFTYWFSLLGYELFLRKYEVIHNDSGQAINFFLFQAMPILSLLFSIPYQFFHFSFFPIWLIVHFTYFLRIGLALVPFALYGISNSDQDNWTLFGFIISGLTLTILWLHPLFDPIKILTVSISSVGMFLTGKEITDNPNI